jgi:tetratricopeptide (TPR) repeat protein
MKSLVRIVGATGLALALLAATSSACSAQERPAATYTAQERAALQPLQAAIEAKDWTSAESLLPPAIAAAQTPDGRYALGRFQLELGIGRTDTALQRQGLENLVASGRVPPSDLAVVYRNLAILASNAGDKTRAETAYARVVELIPGDADALVSLAQVRNELGNTLDAVQLMQRAIEAKIRAGQAADETWYKYALKLAYDGRADPTLNEAALALSRELVTAFPTPENWRDAMLVYRDTTTLDPAAQLDLLRFMRATGALAGERDWYDLADGLYNAGNFAEAKAVLDDGTATRRIDPGKEAFAALRSLIDARLAAGDRATLAEEKSRAMAAADGTLAVKIADALFGYGEHAEAIALYRAALAKGGVDASLVNVRLGMALLASGDRAGAREAVRGLSGSRATLGALWLLWLDKGRP